MYRAHARGVSVTVATTGVPITQISADFAMAGRSVARIRVSDDGGSMRPAIPAKAAHNTSISCV
ncbi:MAG: hypothetical protein V4516_15175 [Pseudomonadota bacterium]